VYHFVSSSVSTVFHILYGLAVLLLSYLLAVSYFCLGGFFFSCVQFFYVYLIFVWLLHIVFLQINGKYIIKSGTDFRHFSKIILNFDKASVDVSVEQIAVTSTYLEDPSLKQLLEKYGSKTETLDL